MFTGKNCLIFSLKIASAIFHDIQQHSISAPVQEIKLFFINK